jgi:hypothetical protein
MVFLVMNLLKGTEKMSLFKTLWPFARVAYSKPTKDNPLFKDAISYVAMDRGLDFCFVVEYADKVIVSFKGTGTREDGVKSIKTWLSNIDAYPLRSETDLVKVGRDATSVLKDKGLLKDGAWGSGTIHDGFYKTWQLFKEEITEIIKKFKDKPIFCAGHSRGGSLTELCARHIAKNIGYPCSCIEYGAPAVGIQAYRDEFRLLPIHASLLTNGDDIVPSLPPGILGFRHGAYTTHMKAPWWRIFFKFSMIFDFSDHFQENYEKSIDKYYPE